MALDMKEITKRIAARLQLDENQAWDLQQALNLAYDSGLSDGKKAAFQTVEENFAKLKQKELA